MGHSARARPSVPSAPAARIPYFEGLLDTPQRIEAKIGELLKRGKPNRFRLAATLAAQIKDNEALKPGLDKHNAAIVAGLLGDARRDPAHWASFASYAGVAGAERLKRVGVARTDIEAAAYALKKAERKELADLKKAVQGEPNFAAGLDYGVHRGAVNALAETMAKRLARSGAEKTRQIVLETVCSPDRDIARDVLRHPDVLSALPKIISTSPILVSLLPAIARVTGRRPIAAILEPLALQLTAAQIASLARQVGPKPRMMRTLREMLPPGQRRPFYEAAKAARYAARLGA
jgi:hypothetical protein